jgi:hypothetical protein
MLARPAVLVLAVLAALAVCGGARAAVLVLGSAQGAPGGSAALALYMTPGAGQNVAGIQVDINFDGEQLAFSGAAAGQTAIDANKQLSTNTLGPGRVRALLTGLNQNAIAAGVAITFEFSLAPGASAGFPVVLSHVFLASTAGQAVNTVFANGYIDTTGQGRPHAVDLDRNRAISLSELLRVIQFYNSAGFQCGSGTEDGYAPGAGSIICGIYDADYSPQDWQIGLTEVLRLIQFYNSTGYSEDATGEDGFKPL